jgi:hypothetical protein
VLVAGWPRLHGYGTGYASTLASLYFYGGCTHKTQAKERAIRRQLTIPGVTCFQGYLTRD